jgi:hypothetical protein
MLPTIFNARCVKERSCRKCHKSVVAANHQLLDEFNQIKGFAQCHQDGKCHCYWRNQRFMLFSHARKSSLKLKTSNSLELHWKPFVYVIQGMKTISGEIKRWVTVKWKFQDSSSGWFDVWGTHLFRFRNTWAWRTKTPKTTTFLLSPVLSA